MCLSKNCSKCGQSKELHHFSVTKRNEDGSVKYRNSWCNLCRSENNRQRLGSVKKEKSLINSTEKEKQCAYCKIMLSFDDFYPSSRGSANLSAYCKNCSKIKYYDKEKAKLYTKNYRERNKNRWRAMHRIHQFNRRATIKAVDDGTVTGEFIDFVYSQKLCYWCGEEIPEENRTLEHITELSNGGLHSASNITMACLSCNSSRFNKGVKTIESN